MTDSKKEIKNVTSMEGYQPITEGYQPKNLNGHLAINGYQPQGTSNVGSSNPPISMQHTNSTDSVKHGYQPPQTRPVAPPPKKP